MATAKLRSLVQVPKVEDAVVSVARIQASCRGMGSIYMGFTKKQL